MKRRKITALRNTVVLLFCAFLIIINGAGGVYAAQDMSNDGLSSVADEPMSYYVGTSNNDGVVLLSSGGGYRFYSNATCTKNDLLSGGSYELNFESGSANNVIYLKTESG